MPDLLTLKSKVELGCDNCDTCCKYRGDIRLTIKNIFEISKSINVTPLDFIEDYTHEIEGEAPERALNSVGEFEECIMYDSNKKRCSVNGVKPLQCVVFPLVPESIKNDYFYVKGNCKCQNKNLITVDEWLNGNNKIYKKNKEINLAWVNVMEEIEYYWENFSDSQKQKIKRLLYKEYNFFKTNIDRDIKKNIKKIYESIDEFNNKKNKTIDEFDNRKNETIDEFNNKKNKKIGKHEM